MKFKKSIPLFLLAAVLLFTTACNNSTKTKESKGTTSDGKEAVVEVEIFDAMKLKNQIVETIQNAPDVNQIVDLLNKAGASYILDLTVPADNAEKYMTTTQQSLGLGMYSFDLYYASVYNRGDMVAQTMAAEQQLIDKLGLTEELDLSKNYSERIKANSGNKDSLDYLVVESMNYSHQQFASGEHPGVYALSFMGSNIEALYVLSQLTLLAQDNTTMLKILSGQKERVKSIFTLMELMSGDENVKPIYEEMIPLVKFFEEHPTIGAEELKVVAPMIEKIHNSMI